MSWQPRERVTVAVHGGDLTVGVWGPVDGPVVVAAHGITSSHLFWALVAERLAADGIALWAPDLRGRGASAGLSGASIGQHAEDLLAVATAAGQDHAVLAGHSMGGFVAAVAAARHPDAVARLVLVDGGPPMADPLGPDDDVEAVLHGIIGPALDRLDMTFDDPDAYADFWRAHPAMAAVPGDLLAAYAAWDLRADGEGWRSRVDRRSVIDDARDSLVSQEVRGGVERVVCPTRFLVASRGMLDGPEPLYDDARVQAAAGNPQVAVQRIQGTNHYTIGMGPQGADAVATALATAVTEAGR